MKSFCVVVFVVLTVIISRAEDEPYNCIVDFSYRGSVYRYDLTPLYHDTAIGTDTIFKRFDGNVMFFNFCGFSSSACWTPDTSLCMRDGDFNYYSAGVLDSQWFEPSPFPFEHPKRGITVHYSSGDSYGCPNGQKRRTTIHIHCKKDATVPYFSDDYTVDYCNYTFNLYSSAGCATVVN